VDTAVDMRFSGKMYQRAWPMSGQELRDELKITNVALNKNVPGVIRKSGEIFQITGIGQYIEIDDLLRRLLQPLKDEIAADKTCAAGN
jgi:hypothetical protein